MTMEDGSHYWRRYPYSKVNDTFLVKIDISPAWNLCMFNKKISVRINVLAKECGI